MLANPTFGKQAEKCRECRADLVSDFETGEQVCAACGIVSKSDDLRFSGFFGAPAADLGSVMGEENSGIMYYLSLPAKIDARDVDARGKPISEAGDMNRLRRLNNLTIASDSKR